MSFQIKIHYDNHPGFQDPHIWIWSVGSALQGDFPPAGQDTFGFVYDIADQPPGFSLKPNFSFKFKDGPGTAGPWEDSSLNREYRPLELDNDNLVPNEIWCKGNKAFVYPVEPRAAEAVSAETFLGQLSFKPGIHVPGTGGFSGLGANLLADGRILFGLYQPNAARVYLMGSFNAWQRPGHEQPDPGKFIELKLYRGYFGVPNIWLVITEQAKVGDEYKFFVQGGVPTDHKGRSQLYVTDPYARRLGTDFRHNNSVIVDPASFQWGDANWATPDPSQLILYELSVYGFTEGDPDIQPGNQGKFKGITERIQAGYFDQLGVTALSLMPLAEFPSMQGPGTLGYDPSLYFTVERDFGSPHDLRQLVNTAHQKGLAVLLDQVFNHTSNQFNPLWRMILEHPGEEGDPQEGGLYFNGTTPWGNRVATEKADVQYMLIDACKLWLKEYHGDGFRFDATHSDYMDHGFLERLARELKGFKPDVLLVAENLPNQPDLNRQGYDGYAQWCNQFHDKIKALMREGPFDNSQDYNTDNLGDIFYFSKQNFASHTNNVVNYCESHDEHSIPYEIHFTPALDNPAAKDRKGRLGLFSAIVALGQPMIYMGQEYNTERPRNIVTVNWPADLGQHGFFQWASRLIQLRKCYPGLKLRGYNPAETGQFAWIIGPWMAGNRGGGRKVIGWRARPNQLAHDTLVIMLNFENREVRVDVDFGIPGTWLKLADMDRVNDVPPVGTNSIQDPTAIRTDDGTFSGFTLPSSSGFIYKWEAA
jgi:1,4-alpha-glucan branching enzyme